MDLEELYNVRSLEEWEFLMDKAIERKDKVAHLNTYGLFEVDSQGLCSEISKC
jgi:hypothetical protein